MYFHLKNNMLKTSPDEQVALPVRQLPGKLVGQGEIMADKVVQRSWAVLKQHREKTPAAVTLLALHRLWYKTESVF